MLNEEKTIGSTLNAVKPLGADEVIVVDGGSTDHTREIAGRADVRLLSSPAGRALQMNYGAKAATGDILLFLHADTRLPLSGLRDVRLALEDPKCVGGRFDVELDSRRWILRLVGKLISLRSRLTRVATGDQGIFVRRTIFEEVGGFPEIPLMEDVAFSRALKRRGKIACLRSRAITSARRWQTEGIWRTIFKMWGLKLLYLTGVSPFRLERFYGDSR